MGFAEFTATVTGLLSTNKLLSGVILVVLTAFAWKKPWEFFKLAAILVGLLGLFYVFSEMTMSARMGTENKREITTERELFNE
jgi:uncharacterized membrane protein YdcZ (DUF606 family)